MISQFVLPYYLQMMGLNPLKYGSELLPALLTISREVPSREVIEMMQDDDWRLRVVGAWMSLVHDEAPVAVDALKALVSSHGSLDSIALVTAAVTLRGGKALVAIQTYMARDAEAGWGACGFAAAAAEHLGGAASQVVPTDNDRSHFARMLERADQARSL